ncbi:hypothetical protein GOBAR_AA32173 [Gossypium barbadense]|uniref:Leucine-rich repeat-containing N-terminal plant-type domain-containing protein n=1 Tax=Gossypium barbadense TaxID=3634 RepID=A0A2P5WBP1_GOSBA|nr:hypothetical protein GOBAR_AA32173 [Gossypium barbadense]
METGWWSNYSNISVHHCTWPGVRCSSAGSVIEIDLSGHGLNGSITPQIGALSKLKCLNLSSNNLRGELPSSLGNLAQMAVLDVSYNEILSIPLEIEKMENLVSLNLTRNLIVHLPSAIGLLTNLTHLIMNSNPLRSIIPPQIWNLKKLMTLHLGNCQLYVSIPPNIGKLKSLVNLNLSNNMLVGPIPSSVNNLTNLASLDLYGNQLNGFIPQEIGRLTNLVTLDLSSNMLLGLLHFAPETFIGNKDLCGSIQGFRPCPSSPNVIFILFRRYRAKALKSDPSPTKNGDLFYIWNFDGKIAFEDIIKATEDFDIKYCIGTGGYGSVYRAILPSGKKYDTRTLSSSTDFVSTIVACS